MPESERKIEKLLRAVAKRRRADTGRPFEMHPSTRNLLQHEIATRARTAPAKESFLSRMFRVPRPRLAFAVSLVTVVAVAALLVPSFLSEKPSKNLAQAPLTELATAAVPAESAVYSKGAAAEARRQLTSDSLEPTSGLAAATPASSATVAADKATAPSIEDQRIGGYAARTVSPQGPAQVPQTSDLAFDLGASAKPPSAAAPGPDRLARFNAEQPVNEGLTAITNSSLAYSGGSLRDEISQTVRSRDDSKPGAFDAGLDRSGMLSNVLGYFARLDGDKSFAGKTPPALGGKFRASGGVDVANAPASTAAKSAAGELKEQQALFERGAAVQKVLASFRVIQAGDELQVIDGDGSLYNGRFEAPEQARGFAEAESLGKKLAPPKDAESERWAKQTQSATRKSAQSQPQSRSFAVSGTNRTLNALVVLNATLLDDMNGNVQANKLKTETTKLDGYSFGSNVAPSQLLNSRISGTARIGGRDVPIEARRVGP